MSLDPKTQRDIERKVFQVLDAFGITMAPDGAVSANVKLLRAIETISVNDLYQQNAAVDGRLVISNCGTVKVKNATKLI